MAYNYRQLFEKIVRSVADDGPISLRMHAVIAECAQQRPHPDWDRLNELDFDADATNTERWLETAFPNPAHHRLREGLWFGLFNPVRSGKPTADAYVIAAPNFDETSIEWACDSDEPNQGSYLYSSVLRDIYSIAYASKAGLENDAEYPLVLAYGGIAARTALTRSLRWRFFPKLRGAAAGFDSGDFPCASRLRH